MKILQKIAVVALALMLAFAGLTPANARSHSFGGGSFGGSHSFGGGSFGGGSFGGSHSFGGGSFGGSRSSGGGSFGSSPSSGGSFGGQRSYTSSPSSGGSFGGNRSFGGGTFGSGFGGSQARTSSSNIRTGGYGSGYSSRGYVPSAYYNRTPIRTSVGYYGGSRYVYHYYGGWNDYSFGWAHPMWYYYTPFYPTFYYNPPYYNGGVAYPGGFNWTNMLVSILFFLFIIWLITRIASRGNNVRVRNW